MAEHVSCTQCGERIRRRDDLVVAGKLLLTFHRRCYAKLPGARRFFIDYPVNGTITWVIVVLFLLAGVVVARTVPGAEPGLWAILAVGGLGTLGLRIASWIRHEQKLD